MSFKNIDSTFLKSNVYASVRDLLKNTTEDTPILIVISNDAGIFLLLSYVCGLMPKLIIHYNVRL